MNRATSPDSSIGNRGRPTAYVHAVLAEQVRQASRGNTARWLWAVSVLPLVACCLSLGFGIMAGWCGTGLTRYMSFFGGMQPVLVIPTIGLSIGLLVVLLFAALVAVGPAVSVGRTRPLELLQEGRSTLQRGLHIQ